MALITPRTKEEKERWTDSAIQSYQKEMWELEVIHPHFKDLYYSSHLGVWILETDTEEWECRTKSEALYELAKSSLK